MEIGGLPIVYRNYGLVVSLLVFVPLSTLAALLRVYTRAFLVKNFGPDDGFLCLSVVRHQSSHHPVLHFQLFANISLSGCQHSLYDYYFYT